MKRSKRIKSKKRSKSNKQYITTKHANKRSVKKKFNEITDVFKSRRKDSFIQSLIFMDDDDDDDDDETTLVIPINYSDISNKLNLNSIKLKTQIKNYNFGKLFKTLS